MQIELLEPEATLLLSILNQHIVSQNKKETPIETSLMVKIVEARNEAIKNGTR